MPRYRFTYTVETPLAADDDITFKSQGFSVTLYFSHRVDPLHVRLDAVVEEETWKKAIEAVMDNIISPVLDALALHRKAPAMLQRLLCVVKSEEGHARKAIVIESRNEQRSVQLEIPAIKEVQNFLDNPQPLSKASIRWLRYCYRPITVLERFVYSWLAFEDFVGTCQVQGKCPTCESDLPPHPAINRDAACALISSVLPDRTIEECKRTFREWWTELRSAIFHGGRVANTSTRSRIQTAMDIYRPAIESRMAQQANFKVAYGGKNPNDGLVQQDIHHFIEFPAQDVAVEFADPPQVQRVVEDQRLPAGVTLLNFEADTQNW
jgi:hypothetical protein